MTQLQQLLDSFERRFPLPGAEEWDRPGLIVGNPGQQVSRVLLTVDVTAAVVAEAVAEGFDLIFAHHPYLLKGVNSVAETGPKGSVLTQAIRAELAIYSAHTNADIVEDGVSDTIAKRLGLSGITPLVATGPQTGHGRIGYLAEAQTLGEFARQLAKTFPATASGIRVAGDYNAPIEKVALCGGAGDSFISQALEVGADVYISSDLRHHVVLDAREFSTVGHPAPAIIDVSHWASEWLWLEQAAGELRTLHPEVAFEVCDLRTDPWDFAVTQ